MACFLVQPLFLAASPAIALPPQSQKFKPKTFDTRTSSEDLAQVVTAFTRVPGAVDVFPGPYLWCAF